MQADTTKARAVAQHAVHAEPGQLAPRTRLAGLLLQQRGDGGGEDESASAEEALAVLAPAEGAGMSVVDAAVEALDLQAVARAVSGKDGGLRAAQRAIMMRPAAVRGWQTLAFVRARGAQV